MKATLSIANPGAVECSMTLTMPLDDWKRLKAALPSGYPAWKLNGAIASLVAQAEARFEAATPYPPAALDD